MKKPEPLYSLMHSFHSVILKNLTPGVKNTTRNQTQACPCNSVEGTDSETNGGSVGQCWHPLSAVSVRKGMEEAEMEPGEGRYKEAEAGRSWCFRRNTQKAM